MTRVIIETDQYQIVYGYYNDTLNYVRKSDNKAVRVSTGKEYVDNSISELIRLSDSEINQRVSDFISFDNDNLKSQQIKGFNC